MDVLLMTNGRSISPPQATHIPVSYTHLDVYKRQVVTNIEGTKASPEFLQAIAYEVYVKNVTFGLLHQWLTEDVYKRQVLGLLSRNVIIDLTFTVTLLLS